MLFDDFGLLFQNIRQIFQGLNHEMYALYRCNYQAIVDKNKKFKRFHLYY